MPNNAATQNLSTDEQEQRKQKTAYQNNELEQPLPIPADYLFLAYGILVFFAPVTLLSIGFIYTSTIATQLSVFVPLIAAPFLTAMLSTYTLPKTEIAVFAFILVDGALITPLALLTIVTQIGSNIPSIAALAFSISSITAYLLRKIYWTTPNTRFYGFLFGIIYGFTVAAFCFTAY